ncbi:tetratricopeptide repeat protein [Thalassococcus sp. S3]|uniref:tetratricopeptide repeat protein n=1 Tax=Thalassococcus sp. S3 TaxID=2017482 RepID=UPI001024077A|nr:tetratricopeptide repeat protein [Thalassococcus sp. S3]QBF33259.1 hypothetical protein CFI11_18810 [Thalassococcus sp. S3]
MSNSDSFIDEVTEEVRRDRLFGLLKRYGWIAVVAILGIVGAAAWSEYQKAQDLRAAQELGDALIAAVDTDSVEDRATALADVEPDSTGGKAIASFLTAAAHADAGETDAAVDLLNQIASTGDLPQIYRQIATFKALALQAETLPPADRRLQLEALAQPGAPLRLLAQEQLALIDVEEGDAPAAIEKFQAILEDAEATSDLQQRARQAIVALGGTLPDTPTSQG